MTAKLTKGDLYFAAEHLASLRPPGPRPLTAEQLVRLDSVITKMHGLIDTVRAAPERGELVFSWRVPAEYGMTLNEYAGKPSWSKKKIKRAIDAQVVGLLPAYPKAALHGAQLRRWVRVTRFSARRPDEISCDSIGGKCLLDSLTRNNVIHDDNDKWLVREAQWVKAKPGETQVLIEVWSIAHEGTSVEPPKVGTVQQIKYERGPMTKAIIGAR